MNSLRATIITIVLLSPGAYAAVCLAASQDDGATLYRKYCAGCHPDASKLRLPGDIVSFLKEPPISMPAFREDRLSDRNARAIADFMRAPAPDAARVVQSVVTPTVPPPPIAKAEPVVDVPAPVKNRPERPRKEARPERDKKPRPRSFVKKWTIKGLRNGEEITVQNFEITADAGNKLAVVPSVKLADYSVKVTAFEIADKALKLQFTWRWKNSPSYWKTETYDLSLSDDGRKLTGSYTLRASGGQNIISSVWGE